MANSNILETVKVLYETCPQKEIFHLPHGFGKIHGDDSKSFQNSEFLQNFTEDYHSAHQ